MTQSATEAPTQRVPSVLVVLIVHDAADWLRESLSALAAQTYPRLAVLAVDNASTDGSRALLERALGERRVVTLPEDEGAAGALRAAYALPVADEADFILVLHDDAALDPDGVTRLVEAAAIQGVDRIGIVGAKVVDWEDPRELRDVGRSADRFGHPYSPLQPGEIDQGQFDRVLEVLAVSSAAMLISRAAWHRIGVFDERVAGPHAELDLCWRARIAGFRVLMTPLARVRHRAADPVDASSAERHSPRYEEDRAALAAVLKNYSLLNVIWVVPLSLGLALVRLLYLVLARRFEEAYDLLAAWGWNVTHLRGTLSLRRSAQKARRVKDRKLKRFMESAGLRLPRWFQTAERILEEQREIEQGDEGQPVGRRLRDRTASLVGAHPVIVGSFVGIVVGLVAVRGLVGPGALAGGVLPAFPAKVSGFFGELDSAFRTTPLGGTLAASPALGAMGALATLLLGSTSLAQKAMLAGGPLLAAVLMYRAAVRLTGRPGPSVVAAGAYGASAILLWSFSQGRLDLLLALAVLPAASERLEVAFGPEEPPDGRWRFVVGVGVTFAVLMAFLPGAMLAIVVIVVVQLITAPEKGRGLVLSLASLAAAAVLLLPFVPTLLAGGGAAFTSYVGTTDIADLARLAFGPGPGTWVIAAFLPIAAALAFALVGPAYRIRAFRAALMTLAGLALSWSSAAGYLPRVVSNPLAYGALAAVGEATLVAYGLASVLTGLGRESFGLRQIGTALLTGVLGLGLLLQASAAMVGGWAVGGPDQIPAAWAVVDSASKGDFRVLWIGADDAQPFPAPGGDPDAVVPAGDASLRYALTDRGGTTALDTARPLVGSGQVALQEALDEVLSGTSDHAGALLAPFGVRFVVAAEGQLPPLALDQLEEQVDLDLVPAAGLVIFRNAAQIPPAAVMDATAAQTKLILAGTPAATAALGHVKSAPMDPTEGGWNGPSRDGLVALSTEYDGAWSLEGSDAEPQRSFGWATAFTDTTGPVEVRYGSQLPRTIETLLLGLIWLAALWITRKPVAR